MKRKVTTITEEFDDNGKVKTKITETIEEEDDKGTIYPQYIPSYPWWPNTGNPTYHNYEITCNSHGDTGRPIPTTT